MSQLELSAFRKRKRGEKVFKFKVFGARGYPAGSNGSFHENLRALLEFGQVENNAGPMSTWSFQLEARRHPLLHLLLFVVEEPVELALDFSCRHCRYIGWGNHMICNKSYHFVLPSKSGSDEYAKTNVIELQREGHSLHGVLHSNGFGHLLCINGSENGSGLAGHQIMEFWDRLCSGLGAREVSLRDYAKKKGMELRLLYSVAYGRPWFGQWDYIFKRGSYGVDGEMYQNAIKTIQTIPLTLIAHQFGLGSEIQVILCRYQQLSSHSLVTLGDLFHFMLELKGRACEESYPAIMSDASCRWSPKRVEKAIHVVVEALKRAEFQWVARQHVRDMARAYIGDTGLLDFVLKSLGNHMVGKYLVRRCVNPVTKVLEYCLEDVSRTFPKQEVFHPAKLRPQHKISPAHLIKDLLCVYTNILVHNPITKNGAILVASRVILDAKHLAKEYRGEAMTVEEANKKKIYCRVILQHKNKSGAEESTTPYHCLVVRCGATLEELRRVVERTFGETYLALRSMAAESMRSMSPEAVVRAGSKITFVCVDGGEVYPEAAVVNCVCGAGDDDGERMVSCDLCRAWHHTRCVRVPDHHAVPDVFLCAACEQDILRFRCYATSTPI